MRRRLPQWPFVFYADVQVLVLLDIYKMLFTFNLQGFYMKQL